MNRAITVAVLAALLSAGCAGDETDSARRSVAETHCPASATAPMAVAVGARANVPTPKVPDVVRNLMTEVTRNHQKVQVIRLDGDPKLVFDKASPPRGENSEQEKQNLATHTKQFQTAFTNETKAKSPQADLLRALTLAGLGAGPKGTVVLIDSGLQTTAPLRFGEDALLTAQPAEVAEYLRGEQLLPDLKDRTVMLVGFGNTAAPQQELDNRWRANVVAIWKAVAEASGACVDVLPVASTADAAVTSPEVSVVPIPTPKPPPTSCGSVELGEADNVSFLPDSDQFRDRDAAVETLRGLAGELRDDRRRAELVGTTASSGPPSGRVALSKQRADAVKAVFVELQVPEDHITTKGVGSDGPGHVPDLGPNNILLPGPAAQNRKVIVNITCAS